MDDDTVVIIGAGLSGAAAAWSLARRGIRVVVLEQFAPGHRRGSSHGSARIVRRVYGDPLYIRLTGRAFELWREVELQAGTEVLRLLGGLDFGPARGVDAIARRLADAGVQHEVLPAEEAEARWAGMRFEGDVLHHPQAGTLDADAAVTALLALAEAAGADVRHDTPVASIGTDGTVTLAGGARLAASCVVVAAGSWAGPLTSGVLDLPPLAVTQQHVLHFPRRDPSAPPWPSVIHEAGHAVYHLAGGRDGGPGDDRKLGIHDGGRATTADTRDGIVDDASRERMVSYVRRWLPGLDPAPSSEITCLYTETPSQDFLLDRVENLVLCSPCSGHGAKFAPLVGEWVAKLVTGSGDDVPDRFRLAAHGSPPARRVSL